MFDIEEVERVNDKLREMYIKFKNYCVINKCTYLIKNISYTDFKEFCYEHTEFYTKKLIIL